VRGGFLERASRDLLMLDSRLRGDDGPAVGVRVGLYAFPRRAWERGSIFLLRFSVFLLRFSVFSVPPW